MKSISKNILVILCILCTLCGCAKEVVLKQPYDKFKLSTKEDQVIFTDTSLSFFSNNLCVTNENNINIDAIENIYVGSGGIFDITNQEVLYGYNLFEKIYPASTTKILTAYIALKYCELDELVTISENAVQMPDGAVTCGIQVGDVLSVEDLLYALMLLSANDAAVALAEHISGSEEAFADLMNRELAQMGATNTHFITPNGLHEDEHYTTIYDMYLLLNEAIQSEMFCKIIHTPTYTASYQSVRGGQVQKTYSITNKFLNGEKDYPDNFTIIGGKTGTTYKAGKCLVILVEDEDQTQYILLGFGCESYDILYQYLNRQMEYINQMKE